MGCRYTEHLLGEPTGQQVKDEPSSRNSPTQGGEGGLGQQETLETEQAASGPQGCPEMPGHEPRGHSGAGGTVL